MKRIILFPALVAAGLGTGGAGAFALRMLMPQASAARAVRPVEPERAYVAVPHVLAPLVMADGRLAGYVSFDLGLEVETTQAAAVTQQLPMLLHAINMRTYRTPLAAGPDGLLPDVNGLRAVAMAAAPEAFGRGVVRRVAITRAEPA
ncbi:hypothetical protein [uncultured Sphingomonas sp.]|uniref:hypothetical protein n=1 Tax=uncultured Sphingomonas sp. TaxID=158754 RepID=UPI0035CA8E24